MRNYRLIGSETVKQFKIRGGVVLYAYRTTPHSPWRVYDTNGLRIGTQWRHYRDLRIMAHRQLGVFRDLVR